MRNGSHLRWCRRPLRSLLLVALASFAVAQPEQQPPELSIVVTLQPWASIVQQVGGDRVDVTVLLPAGASPHQFEPSPSQIVDIDAADLVILNGGVDAWLERLLEATAQDTPTLRLMELVDFEPLQGVGHDEHDYGHDHEGVGVVANPHIWLDPLIVRAAVPVLIESLSGIDPSGARQYESDGTELVGSLTALDSEVQALLNDVRGDAIVPFHDAWGYFARRYGLAIAATLEPFAGREPSVRYLAETIRVVEASGVAVIFNERQLNDSTARVVAESAGVSVVTLDPLGGSPGPERYQDLILENATVIAAALTQ